MIKTAYIAATVVLFAAMSGAQTTSYGSLRDAHRVVTNEQDTVALQAVSDEVSARIALGAAVSNDINNLTLDSIGGFTTPQLGDIMIYTRDWYQPQGKAGHWVYYWTIDSSTNIVLSAISNTHNTATDTHLDIRQSVDTRPTHAQATNIADAVVATHDTNPAAHADIRAAIVGAVHLPTWDYGYMTNIYYVSSNGVLSMYVSGTNDP